MCFQNKTGHSSCVTMWLSVPVGSITSTIPNSMKVKLSPPETPCLVSSNTSANVCNKVTMGKSACSLRQLECDSADCYAAYYIFSWKSAQLPWRQIVSPLYSWVNQNVENGHLHTFTCSSLLMKMEFKPMCSSSCVLCS